ncbi:MAG: hypothetical protein AAF646_03760 [Pseudomonadota bacterium]
MTGPDDLLRKLGALSEATARFGVNGRVISENGLPSPVQAVLTEIGETVLAQDLTFHFGESGSLTLVVSGHRVLALRDVQGLLMPSVAAQLVGKPLSPTPDPVQRAFLSLLMQIDLLTDPVEVASETGAPFAAPPGAGLGVERLAALVGVTYPVVPPSQFDRFRAVLQPAPSSWLEVPTDKDPIRTGPAPEVARLESVAEALEFPSDWAKVSPKLSIIGHQSGRAFFIGAVIEKSGALLWTIEPPHLGAACRAFHKMFLA